MACHTLIHQAVALHPRDVAQTAEPFFLVRPHHFLDPSLEHKARTILKQTYGVVTPPHPCQRRPRDRRHRAGAAHSGHRAGACWRRLGAEGGA